MKTRRQLVRFLAQPVVLGAVPLAALPNLLMAEAVTGSNWHVAHRAHNLPLLSDHSMPPYGGFPSEMTTGYKNAAGYSGALTRARSNTVVGSGQTYRSLRFDGLSLSGSNNLFVGCQFVSNWTNGWNIIVEETAANNRFDYCTISPPDEISIPHAAWPSAGACIPGINGFAGASTYQIGGADGYQYGFRILSGRGTTINCCDIWGFANAIDLVGGSNTVITNTWIHDAAFEHPQNYHIDGIGYLDGSAPPQNVLVRNCTIASLGNTNGIAFQAASERYRNIVVEGCFLSGFGYTVDMCHNVPGSRQLRFVNNVLSEMVMPGFGLLYSDVSDQFVASTESQWFGNKVDDGRFILPDGTRSTLDWMGEKH